MNVATPTVSPLRQRMIDDMTLRKFSPKTQAAYIRAVINFTRFFGRAPDLADMEDLRQRLDELIDIGKQILSKLAEL